MAVTLPTHRQAAGSSSVAAPNACSASLARLYPVSTRTVDGWHRQQFIHGRGAAPHALGGTLWSTRNGEASQAEWSTSNSRGVMRPQGPERHRLSDPISSSRYQQNVLGEGVGLLQKWALVCCRSCKPCSADRCDGMAVLRLHLPDSTATLLQLAMNTRRLCCFTFWVTLETLLCWAAFLQSRKDALHIALVTLQRCRRNKQCFVHRTRGACGAYMTVAAEFRAGRAQNAPSVGVRNI